jgi:predicted Fe-S protein YdhL (DUF1289 family)
MDKNKEFQIDELENAEELDDDLRQALESDEINSFFFDPTYFPLCQDGCIFDSLGHFCVGCGRTPKDIAVFDSLDKNAQTIVALNSARKLEWWMEDMGYNDN